MNKALLPLLDFCLLSKGMRYLGKQFNDISNEFNVSYYLTFLFSRKECEMEAIIRNKYNKVLHVYIFSKTRYRFSDIGKCTINALKN